MNCPLSQLSFTSASARMIRSWPAANAIRQPIMWNPLLIEWISMPTSFAPSTDRKLNEIQP